MTFDAQETSIQGGRPVEIYTFARETQVFRYTSADRDVTVSANLYTATAISRSGIESSSQELSRSPITVRVPRNNGVADLYRIVPPSTPITLVVAQYHDGDGAVATIWTGRVLSVEFAGAEANIRCEPIFTSIKRNGLRRFYQTQCPHVLYGPECGLNRDSHRLDANADSVSGLQVSVSEVDAEVDGFYSGGYFEYLVSGVYERRFIVDHTGPLLTCSTLPQGVAPGTALRIFKGCDHTADMCESAKFGNNILNYGGFLYFPDKNPFGGAPIF